MTSTKDILRSTYSALFGWAARRPRLAFGIVCAVLVAGLVTIPFLRQESLPPDFKETDLVVRWEGSSGASHPAMNRITTLASRELRTIPGAVGAAQSTPPNFKIAFIGDQGFNANSVAVLNLIKSELAEAVVHQGDYDYEGNPAAWDARISNVLGANFPYFASIGNHDASAFRGRNGYQEFLTNRMIRVGISWSGELGVRASFYYKGIFFVQVAPGIKGFDSGNMDQYIRDQLAQDNSVWSICSWHKNMHLMQAGGKSDETGWGVYEESRKGGAIIATGHEHSYFRTHLLSSMINQTVASTLNTLTLTKGNSFVFVSGLGGNSIRDQEVTGPWIAKIYANPCLPGDSICRPNARTGALFALFNVDGQPNKAFFYFKDVSGVIVDSFTVISEVEPAPTPTPTPTGGR
jgi:hypothetical protein